MYRGFIVRVYQDTWCRICCFLLYNLQKLQIKQLFFKIKSNSQKKVLLFLIERNYCYCLLHQTKPIPWFHIWPCRLYTSRNISNHKLRDPQNPPTQVHGNVIDWMINRDKSYTYCLFRTYSFSGNILGVFPITVGSFNITIDIICGYDFI